MDFVEKLRLIGALNTDSLLLWLRRFGDDGRAAGDAGGAVLRLQPRAACPRQSHASQDRPFRRPVGSEGASGALLQRCGTALDRSRADDAYVDCRLLLRHSFGASAVRGGSPQSGLSP